MKQALLLAAIVTAPLLATSQELKTNQLIELGRYYSSYMFMNDPPKSVLKEFGEGLDDPLQNAVAFIKEASKRKNKLLTDKFLMVPDSVTLKAVYIVKSLHQNPHKKKVLDKDVLIDSLLNSETPYPEYYASLFTAVGNKNKPFNLSKINFKMSNYGLDSDLLRGIFYLRCMNFCTSHIFGYMNIVRPPNTAKALSYINNFPKFDDSEYYRYTNLYFKDFELELFNDQGLQSYKDYFVNKLYSTLLDHLICLKQETGDQKQVMEVMLGSILKDRTLYKHTEHKEKLERMFQKQ